ncbi:TPA: class I SAM-dependent methyltransferase [Clostridioides difficile]|uniref:Eco57I restriction-modification methylase domain-containing protein n=1 Tax=Clostridioides difficile TaxID=1496 RepID=UPI0007BB8563|nr:class I SAM-dependent methyltransferase [Clostridioides difficile]EGT4187161.1 class I SAM-dependent methyltransferase [Clostridioides difficile]EGT4218267.1 class I SAM-dependent methyltransferase [Clostridioides difficile]MCD8746162.1 class I SAM-dependent methyltransferase [Clostridioides difficile]MDL0336934.1 class I SAM-dependent methyltransferase [Clostridioides difficile]MDS6258757.1 class I SAM-dependent methyltransferase [Clostridioides difficile]
MLLREHATEERLNGRYYTPENLANYIVDWAIKDIESGKILEPSCGDGSFLESMNILNLQDRFSIVGIELDTNESMVALDRINNSIFIDSLENLEDEKTILDNIGCKVINEDFYTIYENIIKYEKFNIIVGNPPYIRYQYLTEEQRNEQSIILKSNGMKSNKLINAWVSFVVASIQMLNKNGKLGLVIPAELMQVAYAEELRRFLMIQLQKMTIVTFRELIFPNVEQEVVILLGEKDENHKDEHKLRIVQYDDINQLTNDNNIEDIPFNNIEISDSKWTRYFLNRNSNELINSLRKDNRFVRFGDIASVDVGITTGNNDYFCVDNQTVNKFDLKEISKPLIARSVNLNGIKFTREDWKYNINRGAKTYLIDFPDIPYEQYSYRQREYIEKGEREEQNTGYKCRIRQRWYRVPSIWLPDAFLLRRNHLYPKFILNSEVEAVSTDTMHRIRFNEDIDHNRVLLSYYNSITLAFTEIEGRSYGGGVLEILPGEFEKVIIPDLQSNELITNDIVNYLIQEIDTRVRNNNDIEDILDLVDETILIEILGIDRNIVDQFRKMWLILKNRRLNRKRIKK